MSTKKVTETKISTTDEARIDMKTYAQLLKRRWETRATKTRPLYISGHLGIGKSQTVYEVCRQISEEIKAPVKAMCVSMHCLEAPDFSGLSYVLDGKTLFGHPGLLPSDGYGILFLDELNRANKDLLQAALTLIENREINGHKLGSGWIICCAGNLGSDATDVMYSVRELDPALKDRLTHYTLSPKASEVIEYLKNKYSDANTVVKWITSEPSMIALDGTGKTSPRALEYLIKSLDVNKDMDKFTIMAGEIGNSATIQYQKFLHSPASVDVERLLEMGPEIQNMMKEFHVSRKKALEEGKINDVSIINQWIDLLYNHVNNIKKDCEAKQVDFTLVNRPELAKSLATFLLHLEVFEWTSTFVSRIGWLHIEKEKIQKDILEPLLNAVPGLKENLKKVYAESAKRNEVEEKRRKQEEELAAKKAEKTKSK